MRQLSDKGLLKFWPFSSHSTALVFVVARLVLVFVAAGSVFIVARLVLSPPRCTFSAPSSSLHV